jgi:phosphomannomutase
MNKSSIKFGTDGWREVIADEFTFENVEIVSRAIGNLIIEKYKKDSKTLPILIGYDPRFLAKEFAKAAANELSKLGINSKISDSIVPTPVMAFHAAMGESKTLGAIQFTASHNPPKYCGIKYIMDYGGPAPEEVTNEIMRLIEESDVLNGPSVGLLQQAPTLQPNITSFDPKPLYFSHIKKLIDFDIIKKAKLKVVYDPLYGAGRGYLDALLKESGCEVITLHNTVDPLFGGLLPEPREEHLVELKEEVIRSKSSLGLGTDGDSDRLGAIDEKGAFYLPNKIASMLLRHLVKNKKMKGSVVRTLSTTHLLDHLATKYGLETIETKVGYKWIAKEMLEGDVLIGAEESGGISIKNHVPDKDAVLAGMLLAEMMAYEGKSLAEIYEDTVKDSGWSCVHGRFDMHTNDNQKDYLLANFEKTKYGNLNVIGRTTLEGVKILLEDGSWFMARASGTEPMSRVYFEATSKDVLDKIMSDVKITVDQAMSHA